MGLFFRLNVLSGKLSSFRYAITQSLPRSLVYQYRCIFTNINGIKLKKNNDRHELKIAHCHDVEEYFKKVKKGESDQKQSIGIKPDDTRWGKKNGENNKKSTTSTSSAASMFNHSNGVTFDNESASKQSRLLVKFISKGSANQPETSNYLKPQQPSQKPSINDINSIKSTSPHEPIRLNDTEDDKKVNPKNNNLWIGLVAAGLCGITALFWFGSLENSLDYMNPSKKVFSEDLNATTDVSNKVVPEGNQKDVSEKICSEDLKATADVSTNVAPDANQKDVSEKDSSEDMITTTDVSKMDTLTGMNAKSNVSEKVLLEGKNEDVYKEVSSDVLNTTKDESAKFHSDNMDRTKDLPKKSSNNGTGKAKQREISQTCSIGNSYNYKVPYVIIGGGTSAVSAYRTIRKRVPNAKVLIIANETYPPYMRWPLSKELWSADNSSSSNVAQKIYFEPNDFYVDPTRLLNEPNGGVAILNGSTAKRLNVCDRKVILSDGREIEYDECLLATGTKPQNLLIFRTAPIAIRNKISSLMNISDFQRLKEIVDKSESIAVIGGGFVASEISFALAKYAGNTKKLKVYQIYHEDGNMGMSLPKYLSDWVKKRLENCGVFIIPNTQVDSVKLEKSKLKLGLLNGKLVVVNHVIVALGSSQVDVQFAKLSGLQVNSNGIIVNEYLEAKPHMYVAGDAACFPEEMGKETEKNHDHATATGQLAAENMTGHRKPFTHQSMFWSNMGQQISFESVGVIDAALKTVGVFSQNSEISMDEKNKFNLKDDEKAATYHNKGVIFYLKKDKVIGIVLWNVLNKINIARQVIADGNNLNDIAEIAKLFEIEEH